MGVSDLNNGVEAQVCSAPNITMISLPLASNNLDEIAIQLDYAELVAMSSLAQDDGSAPGCMSGGTDPECEEIFENLGLPWGSNASVDQSVFSIVEL